MLVKLQMTGLPITGLNADVAPAQWEFQVCSIGIDAADSLVLLRYICSRVLETHNLVMDLNATLLEVIGMVQDVILTIVQRICVKTVDIHILNPP